MEHTTELLRIAQQQSLDPQRFQQLQALASPQPALNTSDHWLRKGLLILAALCLGLALIFWVAANWQDFSNFQRFAIAQTTLGISLLAGCFSTRLRPAALLLALLALGGLLALYAQVYSTSADSWRLFAIWAAMALPIALAARHQAVWIPWTFIVLIANSLWLSQSGRWSTPPSVTWVSWGVILVLATAMYPRGILKAWLGGASHLAFRWIACLGVIFIGYTALAHLFDHTQWMALFGLLVLAAIAGALYTARYLDISIYALCMLCIDVLLVASAIRLFIEMDLEVIGWIFITLLLGIISVALLTYGVILLKKIRQALSPDTVQKTPSVSGSNA